MFTAEFLSDMRKRALRKGVWYRTLDRVERGIVSLTARLVDRVESKLLGVELVKILSKLVKAMKSEFVRLMESFGFARAREIARQAMEWGCKVAAGWASDLNFSKYLSLMEMNKSMGYGV